jgi:hypothetical protein
MTGRGERWLGAVVGLLPLSRRAFGEALLAEAALVPAGRRRWAWLAGGFWFVGREVVWEMRYGLGVAASAVLVAALGWFGTSDDSSQVVLAVMLVSVALLGFAVPRRAWLAAVLVGSALGVAGMVEGALGAGAGHLPKPGGVAGGATLLVLVLPAFAGAYLGAGARRLLRPAR